MTDKGLAAASSNPTVWYRRCCARLGWTASSLRADMIFGKDTDCLKGSECRDAETGSFGVADVFGQQHSLRRRQHDIFGGRAVRPTPLSVPNPHPLANAIGD